MLALLDNRITKTRYGQIFFDSLPRLRVHHQARGRREVFQITCLKFPWNRLSPPATRCAITKGKCENVHGHNFKVQVIIEGEELDDTGHAGGFYRRESSPCAP